MRRLEDEILEPELLTSGLSGTGGRYKARPEDFVVREIPLYPASGQGSHTYVRIRKKGITTHAAIERLARFLGFRERDVGCAGLKDAQAVTEQTLSLEHVTEERLGGFSDDSMEILNINRHTNKLKTGHLRGNEFDIKLRETSEDALPIARELLSVLEKRGVPNYFGEQRFGKRNDSWKLGRHLLEADPEGFLRVFLGSPIEGDPPDCRSAREAFDAGELDAALAHWPRHYRDQRAALQALKRGRADSAVRAVDRRLRRLFASAFQSALFNVVLGRRIQTLDKLYSGDLAQKTDSGGLFEVMDAGVEQVRCDRFEISPTGPIAGYKAKLASGEAGELERTVLAEFGAAPGSWRDAFDVDAPGSRRPLRFRIADATINQGVDEWGRYVRVCFSAPSGCYATCLLAELIKGNDSEESDDN